MTDPAENRQKQEDDEKAHNHKQKVEEQQIAPIGRFHVIQATLADNKSR